MNTLRAAQLALDSQSPDESQELLQEQADDWFADLPEAERYRLMGGWVENGAPSAIEEAIYEAVILPAFLAWESGNRP